MTCITHGLYDEWWLLSVCCFTELTFIPVVFSLCRYMHSIPVSYTSWRSAVCVSVTTVGPANTAEPINKLFGERLVWARGTRWFRRVPISVTWQIQWINPMATMWSVTTVTIATFYASVVAHPMGHVSIMFATFPSVCACMWRWFEVFSDWLAVNFKFIYVTVQKGNCFLIYFYDVHCLCHNYCDRAFKIVFSIVNLWSKNWK